MKRHVAPVALSLFLAPAISMAADYQKTTPMTCPDLAHCLAKFPAVPAGQKLRITYASCFIRNSPGFNMSSSAIGVSPLTNGGVIVPSCARHFLEWHANPSSSLMGTMSMPVPVTLNAGKSPEIYAEISGTTRAGLCSISGTLEKN